MTYNIVSDLLDEMGNGITFQYFTYFLNPLEQVPLFADSRDKNEILRDILRKNKIDYESRGTKLAFILEEERNGYFIAKLGRQASIKRNLPPEENFKETTEENWPYCWMVINTNPDDGTGQKIAFEVKSYVFSSPHEQLKHFEDEINTMLASSGYAISVNPVSEEQEFWSFIEENEDKIEKLTLCFNAPNLFGIKNTLSEDLKSLEKEYGSTKVSIELENPAGKLKVPKTKLTEQGVDYIAKGGGAYQVKLKGSAKKVLKSKHNIYTRTFDDLDITIKGDNQKALFDLIGRIFQ